MCILDTYVKYASLFVSCPKFAILPRFENKLLANYQSCLESLLNLTTAHLFLSFYIDTVLTSSPNFVKQILDLSKKHTHNSTCEVTLALTLKNKPVLSVLKDFSLSSVNRVYLRPIKLHNNFHGLKILQNLETISRCYENVAVELTYLQTSTLQANDIKLFLLNLQNAGVKHVTLEESGMDLDQLLMLTNNNDVLRNYNQYQFLQELLEHTGFKQYELCNFSLKEYKSVQNISLWSGKQFIGIGPGAHSCIASNAVKPFERYRVTCCYTSINSKFGLIKSKLTKVEVLEELLYLGLRTTSGISNSLWELATAGHSLINDFGKNKEVKLLEISGFLHITEDAMWIPQSKLVLLNSVLIVLYKTLYESYEVSY